MFAIHMQQNTWNRIRWFNKTLTGCTLYRRNFLFFLSEKRLKNRRLQRRPYADIFLLRTCPWPHSFLPHNTVSLAFFPFFSPPFNPPTVCVEKTLWPRKSPLLCENLRCFEFRTLVAMLLKFLLFFWLWNYCDSSWLNLSLEYLLYSYS